ncbi:MAG TPA: hypothetical protein VMS93_12090, partial [Candidatus Saccharimonadales bacterium]|nr:hypothetical protein [Candidatus Saccharimonadales bacterium]
MGPPRRRLLRAVLISLTLLSARAAGARDQIPFGPRALAMGGAFSAVANDASALFWNPAGLSDVGHQELAASRANLYGTGIEDDVVGLVVPLSPKTAAGFEWYHSGFDDGELGFSENRFDLSVARKLRSGLAAGVTLKYLTRNTDVDGLTLGSGNGLGLDAGLLLSPAERLHLALVAQDLFDTSIHYSDGGSTVTATRQLRAGLAYAVSPRALLALDVDDGVHLGTELRVLEPLWVRAGLERDRENAQGTSWTAGAGFKLGVLRADYAYVSHPALGGTSYVGLSMGFNFNPAKVRIEDVALRPIYASLYKSYERDSIGTVTLTNVSEEGVRTTVRVRVPEFMDRYTERDVVLRPKETRAVPLTVNLPDRLATENRDDTELDVQVAAVYTSVSVRAHERTAQTTLFGAGAIQWGAGVDQAAAFITPGDPAVERVARQAARGLALSKTDLAGNRNLNLAGAIVDALAAHGLTYVPDRLMPFERVSQDQAAVDHVSYPRETLRSRTGDCDDMTVLLCALLGNVGIATQLVDAPGHIFLLMDTGLHATNRLALQLPDERYVVAADEVWVPLEATAVGKGFAEVWKIGSENYRTWAERGQLSLVDVEEAQARYEPVQLPPPDWLASVDTAAIATRLAADAAAIEGWRTAFLAATRGTATEDSAVTPRVTIVLARVAYEGGELDEARKTLDSLPVRTAAVRNDLGAVLARQGRLPEAFQEVAAALDLDRADPGIWLNLGLVAYESGDTAQARELLGRGVFLAGGAEAAGALLGVPAADSTGKAAGRGLTAEEARRLLREASS